MNEIKLCFSEDDIQMKKDIQHTFGNNLTFNKELAIDGLDTVLTVVLPILEFSIVLSDFILTHYVEPKAKKPQNRKFIEINNNRIYLEGYTKEEAIEILKTLMK